MAALTESLKQNLKKGIRQFLVAHQHREYEKKLQEKKLNYDAWIRKQEEGLQDRIDGIFISNKINYQTNASKKLERTDFADANAGFNAKSDTLFTEYRVENRKKTSQSPLTFLLAEPAWFGKQTPEEQKNAVKDCKAEIILFCPFPGALADFALPLLYHVFAENQKVILAYGDEDVAGKDGKRVSPWLKPDWSPDTFLSCFYLGSLVAIRRQAVLSFWERRAADRKEDRREDPAAFLYELCHGVIRDNQGFAMHQQEESGPVFHVSEVLFHGEAEGYGRICRWKLSEREAQGYLFSKSDTEIQKAESGRESSCCVSVIIPSRDNPEVLTTCLHSLLTVTETEVSCEVLVIDNGSREENRKQIEEKCRQLQQQFKVPVSYYYRPMPFNFSRMCNLGADYAKGDFLLFLNDDMEIIQKDWLTLLLEKAALPYAGAVGAKLLYPDSAIIQHAGITNLRVGPAHKLQFLSDEQVHYYGKNRGVHNMLAVTGACLLLKKTLFYRTGGFDEELAVAFNDVDLGYRLYEAGYYNIQRNDVILFHHESLSRGKDGESEEKQRRLLREKDLLYERHEALYGRDPFYHKYLTTDMLQSEYETAVRYQVTLTMPWALVTEADGLPAGTREDACLVIGMEAAMDIYKWKYGVSPEKRQKAPEAEEMGYYFQGYSFVIGSDNACYEKTLLLQNKENGRILTVSLDERYRPDIAGNLKGQSHVELTGYAAKVKKNDIPAGNYRFGMLARERCSRQKLVSWSSWTLDV